MTLARCSALRLNTLLSTTSPDRCSGELQRERTRDEPAHREADDRRLRQLQMRQQLVQLFGVARQARLRVGAGLAPWPSMS